MNNRRRSSSEPGMRSDFVDFLVRPNVARLYELLDLGEGADMKDADRGYQHYVETCKRLGTKPIAWDRELAKWIETC